MFVRGKQKKKDEGLSKKEQEAQELLNDSDEIPDEPLNRDMHQLKQDLKDNYSFNRYTGTLPEDRVKLEYGTSMPHKAKRIQSAHSDIQYKQGVKNLNKVKRLGTANKRTPIMA